MSRVNEIPVELEFQPVTLCFEEFHKLDKQCFPDEPMNNESFDRCVKSGFWAVFCERQLIGYSHIDLTPDLAWIARVAVVPSYRNRGIGNMIMEAMLKYCRKVNRTTIILYVQQDNPAAVHLYEKHGFQVSEESFQYIIPIHDFIEERKSDIAIQFDVLPIPEVSKAFRPEFPLQWSNLSELHNPPKAYVLVFRVPDNQQVGYCRLVPDFPGCFPFELSSPEEYLSIALIRLKSFLSKQYEILKLTFANPKIAQVCDSLGFKLNYRLYKMTATIQTSS